MTDEERHLLQKMVDEVKEILPQINYDFSQEVDVDKYYEDFLKSRCFPETRDKLKLVLDDLNLPFYDPFMIIQKTEGKMAEDDFWIKIEV